MCLKRPAPRVLKPEEAEQEVARVMSSPPMPAEGWEGEGIPADPDRPITELQRIAEARFSRPKRPHP